MRKKNIHTRERSKLYDNSCHSSSSSTGGREKKKKVWCLSAQFEQRQAGRVRPLGRAAIAFHWQGDKQGTAWRQEGHYQRLGQTEIRASFGPVRQSRSARARTHAHACIHIHTEGDRHKGWKLHRGKTVKPGMSRICTLEMPIGETLKCQMFEMQVCVRVTARTLRQNVVGGNNVQMWLKTARFATVFKEMCDGTGSIKQAPPPNRKKI